MMRQSDLLLSTHDSRVAGPSGYQIAQEAILKRANGNHQWPSQDRERISLFHAIYLEPVGDGRYQPFWGLAPRVYYVFDLGWPVKAVAWFNYHVGARTDGRCGGDAEFPRGDAGGMVIGGLVGNSILATFEPGELIVVFHNELPRNRIEEVVSRALPGYGVLGELSPTIYKVSCVPFNEVRQAEKLGDQPEVRYAERNGHVQLVTPGGIWKIRGLIS